MRTKRSLSESDAHAWATEASVKTQSALAVKAKERYIIMQQGRSGACGREGGLDGGKQERTSYANPKRSGKLL